MRLAYLAVTRAEEEQQEGESGLRDSAGDARRGFSQGVGKKDIFFFGRRKTLDSTQTVGEELFVVCVECRGAACGAHGYRGANAGNGSSQSFELAVSAPSARD